MSTNPTSEISTSSEKTRLKLTKLTDDGRVNNYAEFEYKAMLKMKAYDQWKYIEGPESEPPPIPELRKARKIKGRDDNGREVTVTVPGNEIEVEEAKKQAGPWKLGNAKALSLIVEAIPQSKIHLIKRCVFAKQAWEML